MYTAVLCMQYVSGQQLTPYNPSIDIQQYEFNIQVSDDNDLLAGHAVITVKFTGKTGKVWFDLVSMNKAGKGMTVTGVNENNKSVSFTHQQDSVHIHLNSEAAAGDIRTFDIYYSGIPADGLIFSKNKFNHRTIFGDNWPNRARNWLPCKDHLSDKAPVDFIVTAPDHYQVIANGVKVEETNLENHLKRTHWKETTPLPTKVAVIGLADFAVDYLGEADGIPVSSWVFPEQRDIGFHDYAPAIDILPFFIKHIGPYPYKKLANVQSKTIFGGMENAGAIFYAEQSVTGKLKTEGIMAHEIAHQWFGDAATEKDWPHIWLSEGFATEMSHIYLENRYGHDTMRKMLAKDRQRILSFTKDRKVPVVDTSAGKDIKQLLNTNSYQKGGWILQMLRNQLGDALFWKCVQTYYAAYRNKNASSEDLQKIFEKVSGKDLNTFFLQWLYVPENPMLGISWSYDDKSKKLSIEVKQETNKLFSVPLEIGITGIDESTVIKTVNISKKTEQYTFPAKNKPSKIEADPRCKLLFEGVVKEKAE